MHCMTYPSTNFGDSSICYGRCRRKSHIRGYMSKYDLVMKSKFQSPQKLLCRSRNRNVIYEVGSINKCMNINV